MSPTFTFVLANSHGLTREEIEWLKINGVHHLYQGDDKLSAGSVTTDLRHCAHEWKEYRGFVENYRYCEKCNEKKDFGTL